MPHLNRMRPGVMPPGAPAASDERAGLLTLGRRASGNTSQSFESAYFRMFVLAMALCWSPLKPVVYVVPFIVLFWTATARGGHVIWTRLLLWSAFWAMGIVAFVIAKDRLAVHSAVIAVVTYGTLAFLWVLPSRLIGSGDLLRRMTIVACVFMAVEGVLGIGQALAGFMENGTFDLDTGDWVEGTIHPWMAPERAFSNPMFAVNMAFMLLAAVPLVVREKRWRLTFFVGALSFVLASVMHVLFMLFLAVAAATLWYRPSLSRGAMRTVVLIVGLGVPVVAGFALRHNIWTLSLIADETMAVQTPRSQVTMDALYELPRQHPAMPFVGLGPGQFSSRAALIGTGRYFGGRNPKQIAFLPQGSSPEFQEYIENLWALAVANPYWGSTQMPFYSWMSVYTEFGAFALLAIFVTAGLVLLRVKRAATTPERRLQATAAGAGVILLVLLGMQENYWETPQAVLVGAMLLKAMYGHLIFGTQSAAPARIETVVPAYRRRLAA